MSKEHIEKYIYFIRHGQDEQGVGDVFQGADSKLTELGKRQATFVAERATALAADCLISSPMPRAKETAQAIAGTTHLTLETNELFREYTPPSDLVGSERMTRAGKTYIAQMIAHMDEPAWHYADEDNYHDLHTRAVDAVDYILERKESKFIVVTHAGFMRVMITAMMTEEVPNAQITYMFMRFLKPENTGITICRYHSNADRRNKWRLIAWNDHAHLAETDSEEPV